MPALVSDALVLRTHPMGETSRVVVLLTRDHGKVRAVAKGARGARPRYGSALEPLSEVRVSLHGRQGAELFRLGECELIRSAFPVSSRGVDAAMAVSYFAELLDAFAPEGETDDALYRLAAAVVAAARDGREVLVLTRYLEAWLLRLAGVYPPVDRCAACGGPLPPGDLHYHAPAHGFVCNACGPASGPLLPASTRTFMAEMARASPDVVAREPRPEAAALEGFHQVLIGAQLERTLRSRRVMQDVARGERG
jgi:DNA repair protein RecO (recombination protein O)